MGSNAWWFNRELVFYNKSYKAEVHAVERLRKAEIVGIFFGGYSSRATRIVTKFLSKFYKAIRENTPRFEIIFCSMDDNEKDCEDFIRNLHGDWLIIPWSDQSHRRVARNQCNVATHPSLVILKNEGEGIVISTDGKDELEEYGEFVLEKWNTAANRVTDSSTESNVSS